MTRLKTEWIFDVEINIAKWNRNLESRCGMSFLQLAARSAGKNLADFMESRNKIKVAVVPITAGLGVISTFAQSVAAVTRVMGFETFITEAVDVNGLYEAQQRGADIVYMADEDRYIALNLNERRIGDNNYATAAGYVTALEGLLLKSEGKLGIHNSKEKILKDKDVLILGYGVVGKIIADELIKKEVYVTVFDKSCVEQERAKERGFKIILKEDEIKKYKLIIDATCEGAWITSNMLNIDMIMTAPGVPYSLDANSENIFKDKVIHDYLEIGTAVMLAIAV